MKQLVFLLFFISVICGCKAQPVLIGVKDHQTVVLELENETEGTNKNAAEEDEQNEIEEEIKLSLMIYMAADNDLESYALQNLNLMETADYEGINVLVLIDRAEGYDEKDGGAPIFFHGEEYGCYASDNYGWKGRFEGNTDS